MSPAKPESESSFGAASWDELARESCAQLSAAFNAPLEPLPAGAATPEAPSIGAEVEIPWSGYFPQLWRRFEMDKGINSLTPGRREELSLACAELELDLAPRLSKSALCGIPRGNDRYWEFAFNPVRDWRLLPIQTGLLERAGLLPNNGKRSLQLTIAGLSQGPQTQALARLLEAYGSSSARLREGVERSKADFFTGWARKGSGGVLQKEAQGLLGGAQRACEFRALELPQERRDFERLLQAASAGALAIERENRTGASNDELALGFREFQAQCEKRLALVGASVLGWGANEKPRYAAWSAYIEGFDEISQELRRRWESLGINEMAFSATFSPGSEASYSRYNKRSL